MVFARLGGAFLALPDFSASYISARMRLFIALGVSIALLPLLVDILPLPPKSMGGAVSVDGL